MCHRIIDESKNLGRDYEGFRSALDIFITELVEKMCQQYQEKENIQNNNKDDKEKVQHFKIRLYIDIYGEFTKYDQSSVADLLAEAASKLKLKMVLNSSI